MKKMNAFMLIRLPLLVLFLVLASGAFARTAWFVDGVHGSDQNNCRTPKNACKTIGHAILLASPDNAILVGPAVYDENLTINFNLGIIGSGASTTIIDGQGLNTVVGIPNEGTRVILSGFTIRNGSAQNYCGGNGGGGIANYGNTTVADSVITENMANLFDNGYASGAGVCNVGTFFLNRSTVSSNITGYNYFSSGSGIENGATLVINNSTISGNSSSCTDVYGAGIYNGGTMFMNNSTVTGNNTGGGYFGGGGLYNDVSGAAILNNSTVYGNTSEGFGIGGVFNAGTLSINNTTVSGNNGTGIDGGVAVILQNTIVADNVGGNGYGTITSNGYNLSSDNTCNFTSPGDLNNIEPKLGRLQNNGGPTDTMAEFLGSPTVDAGNPAGCTDGQGHLLTTDQRGAPRPGKHKHDQRCDMGAFERQSD